MKKLFFVCVLSLIVSGCASVAVSNTAIEQNTAHTLGLAKGSFTITDRVDSGIKSSYTVKTKGGKQFNCYVTGSLSLIGPAVSDPMCTAVGQGIKPGKVEGQCNALTRAAGRC